MFQKSLITFHVMSEIIDLYNIIINRNTLSMGSLYISDVLGVLSNDKSIALFNMVAFTSSRDTGDLMTRLDFTRKQYYFRMNRLIKAGLVTRKSGKYFLTSFGKVVYQSHILIGYAVKNYWKLKAIDSIEASLPNDDLSLKKRERIIDALIERNDIKNILLNHSTSINNHKISSSTTPTTSEIIVIDK